MSLSIFDASEKRLSLILSNMGGHLFFFAYDVVSQKFIAIDCSISVLNLVNSWKYT